MFWVGRLSLCTSSLVVSCPPQLVHQYSRDDSNYYYEQYKTRRGSNLQNRVDVFRPILMAKYLLCLHDGGNIFLSLLSPENVDSVSVCGIKQGRQVSGCEREALVIPLA